jgi:competence protein ComEA
MPDAAARPAPAARHAARAPESPAPEVWRESAAPRADRRLPPRPLPADGLGPGALDRLRSWGGDVRLGVVALVVVALVLGFAWYRIGLGDSGGTVEPASDGVDAGDAVGAPTGSEPADAVVVHVAGAVATPGVMELPAGSRVIDAVEAAGGGLPDADLDRMNLAAHVTDGQRVLVQRIGDPPLAPEPGSAAPAGTDSATPGLINVNTGTQAELETLPGIGPTLAEAIIDERDRRGGFRSVNELRDVRGIGEQRFADIKDLVTV